MKVAWLIQNLVPYHHARFEAFSKQEGVDGHLIQVTDRDPFGVLEFSPESRSYVLHTLFLGKDCAALPLSGLQDALNEALSGIRPDCICVSGWGLEIGWLMMAWALEHRVPVVMFSESTAYDEKRRWGKEWTKSQLVKSSGAALVGGTAHRKYICDLGMRPEAVSMGYNVVDGSHFAVPASSRPSHFPEQIAREPFFLCCSRFGEKKNLPRVVRAYAAYARRSIARGDGVFKLVVAGDGELRQRIESVIADEGVGDMVVLLGAVGYESLPWLYQHCEAFIHASTTEQWGLVVNEAMAAGAPVLVSRRCGCADDLVQDGINGFLYDPYDEQNMADTFCMFAVLPEERRRAMGGASRRMIAEWGPEKFSSGLGRAVAHALGQGVHRGIVASVLLRMLLRKGRK